MKRALTFLFSVLLVLTFTACSAKGNTLVDFNGTVVQPTDFTFETEYTVYDAATETIVYSITNISEQEISYGTYVFDLQYRTEDGWKSLQHRDGVYIPYLATVLPPGQTDRCEFRIEDYYYAPLEAGEYRIVKDNYTSNVFSVQ